MNALEGDWLALVAVVIQLILGIILAIVAIYLAIDTLDRFTKRVDAYVELKRENIAVTLIMADVIVATAVTIQSGVIEIIPALI